MKHEPYSTCAARPSSMFIIYVLIDPRNGEPRYVGQSSRGLRRPQRHGHPGILKRYPGHRANWIRQLQRAGLKYQITVLCELPSIESLHNAEQFWIAEGKRLGWRLTNATDGGEGSRGYTASAETRGKLSAAKKGKPHSPEHRARIAEALRGKKYSEQRIRNMVAGRGKQKMSAKTKEKLRLRNLGNKYSLGKRHSAETRRKMSLAHTRKPPSVSPSQMEMFR